MSFTSRGAVDTYPQPDNQGGRGPAGGPQPWVPARLLAAQNRDPCSPQHPTWLSLLSDPPPLGRLQGALERFLVPLTRTVCGHMEPRLAMTLLGVLGKPCPSPVPVSSSADWEAGSDHALRSSSCGQCSHVPGHVPGVAHTFTT